MKRYWKQYALLAGLLPGMAGWTATVPEQAEVARTDYVDATPRISGPTGAPPGSYIDRLIDCDANTDCAEADYASIQSRDTVTDAQLIALVDPEGNRFRVPPQADRSGASVQQTPAPSLLASGMPSELQRAIDAVTRYENAERHRNRIQDSLVILSELRCGEYRRYLLDRGSRGEAVSDYKSGGMRADAGPIFQGRQSSRLFPELSRGGEGLHAGPQQAVDPAAVSVAIVPGIVAERRAQLIGMLERQRSSIETYSVRDAFSDVSRFHASCSLDAGMGASGSAATYFSGPGVRQAAAPTPDRIPVADPYSDLLRLALFSRISRLTEQQIAGVIGAAHIASAVTDDVGLKIYLYQAETDFVDLARLQQIIGTMQTDL